MNKKIQQKPVAKSDLARILFFIPVEECMKSEPSRAQVAEQRGKRWSALLYDWKVKIFVVIHENFTKKKFHFSAE